MIQIAKWAELFETAKSRTYKNKSKGTFPVKLGGTGYRRLIRQDDGPAMYGCFIALCMVVHSGNSERDGYLTDTGGILGDPYSIEDLSLQTDMPESLVLRTVEFCSSNRMGWMIKHPDSEPDGYHADTTRIPRDPLVLSLNLNSNLNSGTQTRARAQDEPPNPLGASLDGSVPGFSDFVELLPAEMMGGIGTIRRLYREAVVGGVKAADINAGIERQLPIREAADQEHRRFFGGWEKWFKGECWNDPDEAVKLKMTSGGGDGAAGNAFDSSGGESDL